MKTPSPLTISVTAGDIKRGYRHNCFSCPVALAAKRLSIKGRVRAYKTQLVVTDKRYDHKAMDELPWRAIRRVYSLSPKVRTFISRFDRGVTVSPISFTLVPLKSIPL